MRARPRVGARDYLAGRDMPPDDTMRAFFNARAHESGQARQSEIFAHASIEDGATLCFFYRRQATIGVELFGKERYFTKCAHEAYRAEKEG